MKRINFEGKMVLDRTGDRKERLEALYPTKMVGTKIYWMFKCDCGNTKEIRADQVFGKSAKVKSCGCLHAELNSTIRKEALINQSKTHGMSKTRFYKIWKHIKSRCTNPNDNRYHMYGGRGITVCDEWMNSFERFRDDMYQSYLDYSNIYGEKNISIDRIDVNGNYSKNNCKWSNILEQANNKQNTIYVILENNEKISMKNYCRLKNIVYSTWIDRIQRSSLSNKKEIPEGFFKENSEVSN